MYKFYKSISNKFYYNFKLVTDKVHTTSEYIVYFLHIIIVIIYIMSLIPIFSNKVSTLNILHFSVMCQMKNETKFFKNF